MSNIYIYIYIHIYILLSYLFLIFSVEIASGIPSDESGDMTTEGIQLSNTNQSYVNDKQDNKTDASAHYPTSVLVVTFNSFDFPPINRSVEDIQFNLGPNTSNVIHTETNSTEDTSFIKNTTLRFARVKNVRKEKRKHKSVKLKTPSKVRNKKVHSTSNKKHIDRHSHVPS